MPLIILDDRENMLEMLRDSVAAAATRLDGPAMLRQRRAAGADLSPRVWAAMAEAGWLGLALPEDLGGMGLGAAELAVLAEGLGRGLLTEPFAPLAVFPGTLLAGLPASAARDGLAAGLAAGTEILPVLWLDARGARAPLALGADGAITGAAHLVPCAASATGFLVLAEDGEGPVLAQVAAADPGIRRNARPGIDGAALANVALHDAAPVAILGRGAEVSLALEGAIRLARLALAAELAGLASRVLELTVDFTKGRVQFGKSIASFQVVQHRLVDMWADAEFACAAVANAVNLSAQPDAFAQAVLAAKARAGDAATTITRRALHLHGAMGFTDQCDIGLYLKRAVALNATLGQPEELRLAFLRAERAA
jgi:alkylation response protein AidB-like acyl-CoA dehydrogenase